VRRIIVHEVVVCLEAGDEFQPPDAVALVRAAVERALQDHAGTVSGPEYTAELGSVRALEE